MPTNASTALVGLSDQSGPATRSRKRKYTYEPSSNELFPDDPWYALNHEEINVATSHICDSLVEPIRKYAPIHPGIRDLVATAQTAKKLPSLRQFCLAVLGEQGVGKSSLINALLDRDLLDNSGSSQACTALATMLIWKEGESDHSRFSDVKIEFLDDVEIRECIKGQVRRWAEVYPGEQQDNEESDGAVTDDSADENATSSTPPSHRNGAKKVSKAKQRAATTAKDFFNIVFNTQEDEASQTLLDGILHNSDIRKGDFANLCFQRAQQRLGEIGTELGVHERVAQFPKVSDRKLAEKQNLARKLWPFVKLITIATGHVLLRHGLRLFDLPGYGDTSHLRAAVINAFRWKADFEMVVVPCLRVTTSTIQDSYLDRSVQIKTAERTMVVMNKSDQLINQNNMARQIKQIREEPFPTLIARLEEIDRLQDEDEEDEAAIADMIDTVTSDITVAYIKRETDLFRAHVAEKGITEVYSTAASTYTDWKNPYRINDPVITPEGSGIPALRRFLFSLPAKTNILDYQDHIFEKLPALGAKAGRVVEKHIEDKSYAEMRLALKQSIFPLEKELKNLVIAQVDRLVAKAWYSSEQENIASNIRQMIAHEWTHTKIHVSGFAKMLRENGIPLDGKYVGKNLNDDVLGTMKHYVKRWNTKMQLRIGQLGQRLDRPIQDLLTKITLFINRSAADPTLKQRAIEAMNDASRRIGSAYGDLLVQLDASLQENYLRFTTEIDIYCPVAMEMKPVYERASGIGGSGAYARQRSSIADSITYPYKKASYPLAENLDHQLVTCQKEVWKARCNAFTEEAMAQIRDFSDITQQLLMDEAYMTEVHKKAREELKGLLVNFDRNLKDIQGRFRRTTREPPAKKAKRKQTESQTETQISVREAPSASILESWSSDD